MNDLELVTSRQFDGFTLDCYVEADQQDKGAFWATREQIGRLLGYSNPRKSITVIHNRNKDRLDKFCFRYQIDTPAGRRTAMFYNFKGLLEICRYSQQDTANHVIDTLWEIADEIRKTGSYSVFMSAEDREYKRQELDFRKKELDLQTAKLLKDILDNPPFPLTDETRTVFGHEIFKLATSKDYLAMLPECSEKWYTAGDIGSLLGISANKVGRIAKKHGLKAPEGESNDYGRWIFSKSKYSSREVPSFIYSEAGLDWFTDYNNGICKEIERRCL